MCGSCCWCVRGREEGGCATLSCAFSDSWRLRGRPPADGRPSCAPFMELASSPSSLVVVLLRVTNKPSAEAAAAPACARTPAWDAGAWSPLPCKGASAPTAPAPSPHLALLFTA
eukprot:1157597-Pelagomonas_calceolata.AAC.7